MRSARPARMLKALVVSGSETLLAIALVLVFALVSLGILTLAFPRGTGLVSLYGDLVERRRAPSRLVLGRRDAGGFVAVLDRTLRQVRDRPAAALTWRPAQEGLGLEDQHAVQTLARSKASIAFDQAARLELDERSLVVVRRPNAPGGPRAPRSLVLLGGNVRGELAGEALDVVTSGGKSVIERGAGAGTTKFAVALHPDESSTVSIYTGTAAIETTGERREIGPNEAVTYDAAGRLGPTLPIPDPPRPLAPADGESVTYGAVVPRIEFRWQEAGGIEAYRLVLARDPDFTDVVYDGRPTDGRFAHGDLAPGTYHWRVRAIAREVESLPGPVRTLHLRQDLEPPALAVDLPEGTVDGVRLVLRGTVEPGSELYIGDAAVPVDPAGRFEHALTLEPGLNMIVIEAVDGAGNTTYRSSYVTARP